MEPTTELTRRERERRERRAVMLDAARAVFAEKGYEQATLDEVAERAEFGKGTLYNYFEGGKEGILRALIEDLFETVEGLVAQHAEAAEAEPLQAQMRRMLAALMGHFEANRDTFRLVIKEVQRLMLSPEHAASCLVWQHDERLIGLLVKPIEAAIARGELRAFPPEAIARTVFGNMQGVLMHRFLAPESGSPAEPWSVEEAADFITSILFEGLRPRTA